MKLSELIAVANKAMKSHGDIDVCLVVQGESIHETVAPARQTLVRTFGNQSVQVERWPDEHHRKVFVID